MSFFRRASKGESRAREELAAALEGVRRDRERGRELHRRLGGGEEDPGAAALDEAERALAQGDERARIAALALIEEARSAYGAQRERAARETPVALACALASEALGEIDARQAPEDARRIEIESATVLACAGAVEDALSLVARALERPIDADALDAVVAPLAALVRCCATRRTDERLADCLRRVLAFVRERDAEFGTPYLIDEMLPELTSYSRIEAAQSVLDEYAPGDAHDLAWVQVARIEGVDLDPERWQRLLDLIRSTPARDAACEAFATRATHFGHFDHVWPLLAAIEDGRARSRAACEVACAACERGDLEVAARALEQVEGERDRGLALAAIADARQAPSALAPGKFAWTPRSVLESLVRSGKTAEALALLERERPQERRFRFFDLADLLRARGDREGARALFARARELVPADEVPTRPFNLQFHIALLAHEGDRAGLLELRRLCVLDGLELEFLRCVAWWAGLERDAAFIDEQIELGERPLERAFAALGAAQGLLAERAGDLHAWPDRARDQQAVFATRIAILGNSGSGKSTLAREWAEEEGLAVLDLDCVAWEPGQIAVAREPEEARAEVDEFCGAHEDWVIEGCYASLIEVAEAYGAKLYFLDPGTDVCVANCRHRPWEPHKYASKEEQDARLEGLIAWVRGYDTREGELSRAGHEALFERWRGRKYRLGGGGEVVSAVEG